MTASRPPLLERLRAVLRGRRSPRVLVLVATVRGPRAVAVRLDELDG